MGFISGLATHPTDPATAYVQFSLPYRPKILRTTDFGETWEDISGFGSDSVSKNGFPDVSVYSLMVHKLDPDQIWAGTEIGIFESKDNGETWYYADNGMPAVSIWQMFLQDNGIVVATYGRGVWTAPKWPGAIENADAGNKFDIHTYPNPSSGMVNLSMNTEAPANFTLRVFNQLGQQQRQFMESKMAGEYTGQFDLTGLKAGNYVMLIELEGQQYSTRITIQ
jgi:hypothetical protein